MLERFRATLAAINAASTRGCALRFSVGQTAFDPDTHESVIDLLVSSDVRMYAHKAAQKHGTRG